MKEKDMITVIVPVYNVVTYLDRCVNSILAQTYESLEVLLIDDGSTDGSGTLCDVLSIGDQRIKTIHKENGGLSSARNAGLNHAQGKWISFVDSDDYLHPGMLQALIHHAVEKQSGIAVCGLCMVSEEDQVLNTYLPKDQVFEGEALHRYFFAEGKGKEYMCNKLFRKDLFEKIRFPHGKLYEDTFVLPELLEQSHRAVFVPFLGYYYVQRADSISKSMDMTRQFDGLDAKLSKVTFMEQHYLNLVPKAKQEVLEACCWLLYKTYLVKGQEFHQNKSRILTTFHKERREAEKSGILIKMAIVLITASPWLFSKIYGWKEQRRSGVTPLKNSKL